ncbi:hypothetical protein [Xanthomonas phage XPP1]|uniref:Uncharacterized protein n=1 Tax=Xanthomonas phage XPP1 TaxID=2099853 RepID=A0A3S7HE21_9CAUD|nr:hypothetical protein KEM11_gp49 [Xanthomonas phage XPP1]AVO23746.1 hypothetical protein [Xanthomonas phage XPP2]AVO23823.1 hypothetical protein [Xanthomonas phage XPP3]AVO23913.1 hypothetical protein [Xanthomonas phage XPP4]AVO23950.1 hypothetical protein [Xanthomonas phage XPP6]AVO24073.1 hypothetical protein [Xanthomonas phage XPP8]AVO24131.1 hypothetical protein [Xanthomonas phage XPP9]AVO24304.1 hypothetical protein [Xanthomonas phage XPV2]
MKPDWKDAPEWARYLAMDNDGVWVWYAVEPHYVVDTGRWASDGEEYIPRSSVAPTTLEGRPS